MAADPLTADAAAELLHYDLSDGDPVNDHPSVYKRDDKALLSPRGTKRKNDDDKENFLGLDEEVKIAKKRKPIAKLDENRLLSGPGVPKLRAIARSSSVTRKLRMKGKGHEFSDVARLLNFYQLWLDGLYPRANFADGLQLIEKVGHSKRMQVMRKEWIDEGKPGYIRPGTELVESILREETLPNNRAGHNDQPAHLPARNESVADGDELFFPSPSKTFHNTTVISTDPEDDELDALLAMQESAPTTDTINRRQQIGDHSEGEDDLDALFAEQDSRRSIKVGQNIDPSGIHRDEEDDDLDALLAEQETRLAPVVPTTSQKNSSSRPSSRDAASKKTHSVFGDTDSEGEDDLDALLAQQQSRKSTPPTSPSHVQEETDREKARANGANDQDKDDSQESAAKIFSSPLPHDMIDIHMKTYSSSPLPNNPEEEDDLDAILAEAGM